MPTLLSFVPLFEVPLADIRARLDSDVNAGIQPGSSEFVDTTTGGFYYDITQVVALEIERLWQALATEFPASVFLPYAWGTYLDLHGEALGVPRKAAVQSTGGVDFEGQPGTPVASGSQVATRQVDPDEDSLAFEVVNSIVLPAAPAPTGVSVTPGGSGTIPAGSYSWAVTALVPDGETNASMSATYALPANGSATVSWTAVVGAVGYRVYRKQFGDLDPHFLGGTTGATTFNDTGSIAPGAAIPPTRTARVRALVAGGDGNVAPNTVTELQTPIAGVTEVYNTAPLTGGADIESDETYRQRLLLEFQGAQGAGTIADYERWARAYPPIGFVTVEPLWAGPGTVRVIVTDTNNDPVSEEVVSGFQLQLDPVPHEGRGLAPIGAAVTVATPTVRLVTISATVFPRPGYTLDGTGGTIALRDDLVAAVSEYVNRLPPGEDVIVAHVAAQFFLVGGVYDVTSITLNGAAANLSVAALEVTTVSGVTLA